jgi:heptosyltransferase I
MHRWFCNHHVDHVAFQHQTEGFMEFAKALGVTSNGVPQWNLPVSDDAQAWVDRQLDDFEWHAGSTGKTLVISPCSSHAARNWRNEYYAQIADFATGELNMRVVLSGGPSDSELKIARSIVSKLKFPCLNLVGKDTLEQSKALLQRADVVISPDSGPAHIASALDTPVLGLYASTWSRRSGPYNSLDLCVDRFPEAARLYRGREPEALRWGTRIENDGVMDLIKPADVTQKLEAFITQ